MYFSRLLILASALLITTLANASPESSTAPTISPEISKFSVLPATCITLRKGRKCFATVTINLTLTQMGHYCLYQQGNIRPMHCWQNVAPKKLRIAFESAKKVVYILKNETSQKVIALTSVEVSWVHKTSSRKRRWRIF